MDPLSLSASVAGLITIGAQILSIIGNIQSKNSKALEELTQEVSVLRATLLQLQTFVQTRLVKAPTDEEWSHALDTALCECGDTLLGLDKLLSSLVPNKKYKVIWKKVKWTMKEQDIIDAHRRLEAYVNTLQLLLSIKTASATSNIEELMKDVHQKLSIAPSLEPAVRPPISWRQKLAGFQLGATASEARADNASNSESTLNNPVPWIIPSDATRDWHKPGVYGIDRDEGLHAPDLNNPDLISLCEIAVGSHKISLLCAFQVFDRKQPDVNILKSHLVVKRSTIGDAFFLEINAFVGQIHRFAVPVGDSSLILSRILRPESVLPIDAVQSSPEKGLFNLQIEDVAFKCGGDSGSILVNFESPEDCDRFLKRLYALRYMQRANMVMNNPDIKRLNPKLVQIGYASGQEKSFVYPNAFGIELQEHGVVELISAAELNPHNNEVFFRENLLELKMDMVGHEVITFSPNNSDIQNIALTMSMTGAIYFYYSLKDLTAEWEAVKDEATVYTKHGEWEVSEIEVMPSSRSETPPSMKDVKVALSLDRFWSRMKFEIFRKSGDGSYEKEGLFYAALRGQPDTGAGWIRFLTSWKSPYTGLQMTTVRFGDGDDSMLKVMHDLAKDSSNKCQVAKEEFLKGQLEKTE